MKAFRWLAILLNPLIASAEPLAVGGDAPTLSVTLETGESASLADLYAEGPVLVYFYPKADTPGCTKQACNLRDEFAALQDKGLTVLGVSTDSAEAQRAFKEKYKLPFHLVADPDKKLVKAFGVPALGPVAKRQTFLVIDGKIAWRDLAATPATQAADALAALEQARNPS